MLLISDPQAKVTGIHAYKGWCYIGCSSERFLLSHSSYHVELCVSDELDEAVFVAFDMEMEKLANIQAAEAAQILRYHVVRQQKSERLQVTTLNYPHLLYQQAFVMQQTSRSLIQMRVDKEGTQDIAPRDKESPPLFA
ncbi:hypothetical protein Bca4012_092337 [Brassica carinata]|uniref:Uncharacterized protein n=1 Tax=Brassica carinata TaxID=52824 RepID=A0A8X7TV14_BRACI|nr:hypothetical protein Bca52824_074746 [Brassica carinata]